MKKKDRISWIALAAGLLIAGTAWTTLRIADDATETSVGKAPKPTSDVHVDPLEKGQILAADRWPNACALVTQEDVEAILPDAEEIREEPPLGVYTPSIKEFAADSSWKESENATYGRCEYVMELPGETFTATRVWVRVDAVADPELIARYFDKAAPVSHQRFGTDGCANDGGLEDSWTCRKGPLMFTVGGQTTATFEGRMDATPTAWRDDVGPEFVRAVAAKLG
ncbi:hypothetical protein [Streptomyces cavernicola]|uniref:DUF3558 domain-containing protein n=1 Tax=Streptomyces cavernicola TaxID=3043613 RepID=A0ABT6SDC1_9ACTN|nr:hypothetical protein [Streptomyces sp. B-S-A6]MDI3406188.1 hypothetical protein [Streptomyces sp. B-S-A6]